MLPSRPIWVDSDITQSSRSGSIGGLVTCANACRKQSYSGRTFWLTAAIGMSSPIEPIASCSVSASGRSTPSCSSRVSWNSFWKPSRVSSANGASASAGSISSVCR